MGLKLHCNKCNKFLNEITPEEASRLNGNEVCKECVESARSTLDRFNALYKKLAASLGAKHNAGVRQLEDLIHRELDL
jgi:hypothetical protein